MSVNEKKVPKRRFKEFQNANAWEQRKLGEECQLTMGQSPDGSTYSEEPSDYILIQGNADLKNGWVEPRVWTSQKTKTASAGDLIMSVRAPAGAMGKTSYNGVIGRGVAAIKGNEFIYQLLCKMDKEGQWKKLSCGSTFESLNSENIKNAEILIPGVEEQVKLGEYFSTFDNLITLHQRKLEKLKSLKKAYLTDMFPAEGESKPKLRFSGFTDDWEQRKISEIGNIVTGTTPSTFDLENYGGKYLFAGPGDIQDNRYVTETCTCLSEKGFTLSRPIRKGSTLVVCIGSTIGKTAQLSSVGTTNQQINSVEPFESYDEDFIYITLKKRTSTFKQECSTQTMPIINKKDFGEILVAIAPSHKEQQKIGEYFKSLDNLITIHQRKLEKLQNIKKAYLNEMFV